jgi:hypothetical protein
MKTMVSGVRTIEPAAAESIRQMHYAILRAHRAKVVPTVGLVNNFDPDQHGFLTTPLQGFTGLQVGAGGVGTYGTIAPQADYTPPAVLPDEATPADKIRANSKRSVPRPGYPVLIFPVASGGTSFNTSFIRGGKKDDLRRFYPAKLLVKAWTHYTIPN